MKSSRSPLTELALAAGILTTPLFAVVTIDYVDVGYAGNAADPGTGSLYGSVPYAYRIGKYEVSNAQYTEFLNAVDPTGANANGIYNTAMGSDVQRGGITFTPSATNGSKYTIRANMGDKPVNSVSWYDAARFTNWLHNGQGGGSTETGAYTLNGNTGIITRNHGASVWLPSENEWYKAAYYDPTPGAGGGDNYWTYATQSNTAPAAASANATGDISNPGANVANYLQGADWNSQDGNVTTVGSATANNFFGAADLNGNVSEWNEEVIDSVRGPRGGSFASSSNSLTASIRPDTIPTFENSVTGFRVASVPEPSSGLLTFLAASVALTRRRRSPIFDSVIHLRR
jgi:formylglycine-generating enzyme required for sulfatase activity